MLKKETLSDNTQLTLSLSAPFKFNRLGIASILVSFAEYKQFTFAFVS